MNKFEIVLHAFVKSHLDPCNSLYCVSQSLSRLQSVQNSAARLLKGKQQFDRITPI